MGLAENWATLSKWINDKPVFESYTLPKQTNKVLCPDLPVLPNYHIDPPKDYWEKFPRKNLPEKPECDINIEKLKKIVSENQTRLTLAEKTRAAACIESLQKGAGSYQKVPLPSCHVGNASNLDNFGKEVVDTIASWVGKGFVAEIQNRICFFRNLIQAK
jgi:hypothetical protein